MYLEHHGVKGQKWGVRRYRNYDGSLTSEGKKRYNNSVFISGSSKTQQKDSTYFRKELPKEIRNKIDGYIKNNNKILVGEAPGIDSQVQDYLSKKNYNNVDVYTSYDNPRYLANKNWNVKRVDSKGFKPDSPEFLRQKDIAMTNDAGSGLSIILDNGGAGATRNNVKRLINQNKKVEVYMLDANSKNDDWVKDIVKEVGDEILHNDKTLYYNYLEHHGILGQRWGKKNGPPYPLGASDHSAREKKAGWRKSLNKDTSEDTKEKKKFHLSDKQKKYLKIGAAITATALVTAGTVYLAKKTGAYDKGKEYVSSLIGKNKKAGDAFSVDAQDNNSSALTMDKKPDKYIEKGKQIVEQLKDVKMQDPLSSDTENLELANHSPSKDNCSHTVISYMLRQMGLDVEALPIEEELGGPGCGGIMPSTFMRYFGDWDYDNRRENWTKKPATFPKGLSPDEYRESFAKQIVERFGDEDMIGAFCCQRTTGGGHYMAFEIRNKKVYFIDPQIKNNNCNRTFEQLANGIIVNNEINFTRIDDMKIRVEYMKDAVRQIKR